MSSQVINSFIFFKISVQYKVFSNLIFLTYSNNILNRKLLAFQIVQFRQISIFHQLLAHKFYMSSIVNNIIFFIDQKTTFVNRPMQFVSKLSVFVKQVNRFLIFKIIIKATLYRMRIKIPFFNTIGHRYFTKVLFSASFLIFSNWHENILKCVPTANSSS